MSDIVNFTSVNRRGDLLPPDLARNALALIRGLEQKITVLGLPTLVQNFTNHTQNHNNPHRITFDDFPQALIESLYPYYSAITTTPLSEVDYLVMCQDPLVVLELIRRLVLNGYLYQDTVGPVTTPLYKADNINDALPEFYPSYFASYMMGDAFLVLQPSFTTISNYSRLLPTEGFNLTLMMTLNVKEEVTTPTLILSNKDGYLVQIVQNGSGVMELTITNLEANSAITSLSIDSTVDANSLVSVTPQSVSVQLTAPYIHALTFGPSYATYTYSYNGYLYVIEMWLDGSLVNNPIDRMIVTAPIAAPSTSSNSFRSLMMYPKTLSSEQIQILVANL